MPHSSSLPFLATAAATAANVRGQAAGRPAGASATPSTSAIARGKKRARSPTPDDHTEVQHSARQVIETLADEDGWMDGTEQLAKERIATTISDEAIWTLSDTIGLATYAQVTTIEKRLDALEEKVSKVLALLSKPPERQARTASNLTYDLSNAQKKRLFPHIAAVFFSPSVSQYHKGSNQITSGVVALLGLNNKKLLKSVINGPDSASTDYQDYAPDEPGYKTLLSIIRDRVTKFRNSARNEVFKSTGAVADEQPSSPKLPLTSLMAALHKRWDLEPSKAKERRIALLRALSVNPGNEACTVFHDEGGTAKITGNLNWWQHVSNAIVDMVDEAQQQSEPDRWLTDQLNNIVVADEAEYGVGLVPFSMLPSSVEQDTTVAAALRAGTAMQGLDINVLPSEDGSD